MYIYRKSYIRKKHITHNNYIRIFTKQSVDIFAFYFPTRELNRNRARRREKLSLISSKLVVANVFCWSVAAGTLSPLLCRRCDSWNFWLPAGIAVTLFSLSTFFNVTLVGLAVTASSLPYESNLWPPHITNVSNSTTITVNTYVCTKKHTPQSSVSLNRFHNTYIFL